MSEFLFLCGVRARSPRAPFEATDTYAFRTSGSRKNIQLRVEDLDRKLVANIPNRILDLLELATYVHCADQGVGRGGKALHNEGADWHRSLRFRVAVREPDFWTEVTPLLRDVLGFLSGDEYDFTFEQNETLPKGQRYFEYGVTPGTAFQPDIVIPFSGGLDSLGGALRELNCGQRIALLSHLSSFKVGATQKALAKAIQSRAPGDIMHVPVLARKTGDAPDAEHTQRARSFLFGSVAFAAAHLFGHNRLRFYENGIVSLNFPTASHVLGGRASRTTHPRVLAGFSRLFSRVGERPFGVENPFMWLTKTDVIKAILEHGGAELIGMSVSCTRVRDQSRRRSHCGMCSQCLSRRFAIIAARAEKYDPIDFYGTELLTGARPEGDGRLMAETFIRFADEIGKMSDGDFLARFPEVWDAARHLPGEDASVASDIIALHRRHADEVTQSLTRGVQQYARELASGELDTSCILMLSANRRQRRLPDTAVEQVAPQSEKSTHAALEIRIALDYECDRLLIADLGSLQGAPFKLVEALSALHRKAIQDGRAPEHFPYTPTASLAKQLQINPSSLMRRVSRLRSAISQLAENVGKTGHAAGDLIEASKWRGYRLNPHTRLLKTGELEQHQNSPDSEVGGPDYRSDLRKTGKPQRQHGPNI